MPGLYFDELHVGQVFRHPIRRTITEADNVWFGQRNDLVAHCKRSGLQLRRPPLPASPGAAP